MARGRDGKRAHIVADSETTLDVLPQVLTPGWIDRHAVVRRAQLDPRPSRRLAPADPGHEGGFDELELSVRRRIEERRERTRGTERTIVRGPSPTIG